MFLRQVGTPHSVVVAPAATAGAAGAVNVAADGAELGGAPPGDDGATDGNSQKLHACRNCQKAKTACTDQRPCARCAEIFAEIFAEKFAEVFAPKPRDARALHTACIPTHHCAIGTSCGHATSRIPDTMLCYAMLCYAMLCARRCLRLQVPCDDDQRAVKRACTNCKRAKVRRNPPTTTTTRKTSFAHRHLGDISRRI